MQNVGDQKLSRTKICNSVSKKQNFDPMLLIDTLSVCDGRRGQHCLNDIRGDAGDLKCSVRIWLNMAMSICNHVLAKRHKCSNYCSIFMKNLKVLSAPLGRMRSYSQRWCSVGLERLACNQLGQSSVGPGPVSWQHRTSYWPRHYITII